MNHLKKQFFLVLFILSAGLFAAGNASSQTWTQAYSGAPNPCNGVVGGSPGNCMCNTGYTYGKANAGNCTMDGWIIGCWNPNNGTCNTCGQGGTVTLGTNSCFNSGQNNQGGIDPQPVGVSCSSSNPKNTTGGYSASCIGSGTSTGGFSTN